MRYAKLKDNYPIYAPNPIKHNGLWYGNPPPEVYAAEGYKPVQFTEPPGDAPSGYQWSETWAETDNTIVQGWELAQVPITEDEALTNYSNTITGAEDENLPAATETLIKLYKEGDVT